MDCEDIGVIGGKVDVLFEDEFLDAIIVDLYELRHIDIAYVNPKLASFFSTHGIPKCFEILALENPLYSSKKSKNFGSFFTFL